MRWLGTAALLAVILQGILGGLRVTELKDEIGIFHAALAQLFFVLVSAIALFSSRWWTEAEKLPVYARGGLRYLYLLATAMILVQLILGAVMRHQHAGLAIADFPLAYGKVWPAMDAGAIARYNQLRTEATAFNPITAFQVGLQMTHRLVALAILGAVFWAAWLTQKRSGWSTWATQLSASWLVLVLCQAALGAATIWTNKSADIATAHVAVGALSLVTGSILTLAVYRCSEQSPALASASEMAAGRAGLEAGQVKLST
jgi:cytochrome c oxidase assembly protein subunit 15